MTLSPSLSPTFSPSVPTEPSPLLSSSSTGLSLGLDSYIDNSSSFATQNSFTDQNNRTLLASPNNVLNIESPNNIINVSQGQSLLTANIVSSNVSTHKHVPISPNSIKLVATPCPPPNKVKIIPNISAVKQGTNVIKVISPTTLRPKLEAKHVPLIQPRTPQSTGRDANINYFPLISIFSLSEYMLFRWRELILCMIQ